MAKVKKKEERLLSDEDFLCEPTIGSIVSGLIRPQIKIHKPKPKKSPDT